MHDYAALVGFGLAAYSVIANDAIQTLGTFLSSNRHVPWPALWLFVGGLLSVVLVYGWFAFDGDPTYGRLAALGGDERSGWIWCLPPLALLVVTRLGMPVSTTFLILTAFAPDALPAMLAKSVIGYVLALAVGLVTYLGVVGTLERRFANQPLPGSDRNWRVLQWLSTGCLWSQWLVQDLANIFVYLPRRLEPWPFLAALAGLLALLALVLRAGGGRIQRIVTSKTATTDLRSATLIDLLYASILVLFLGFGRMPMSTTWVFLGLLAGRELALSSKLRTRSPREARSLLVADLARATIGLAISVAIAWLLPRLAGPG